MACLDPELSCAICLELFVDPCTLTCMHSFCKACIVMLIEEDSAANQSSVTCPECRHVENLGAKGHNALKKNFTLASILNKYAESSSAISHSSSQSQTTGVQICLTCDEEISTSDVKHMHVNHKRFDLQSGRKILSEDILKKITELEDSHSDILKTIKRIQDKIENFKKSEQAAVDTIEHTLKSRIQSLEEHKHRRLQEIKLYSESVCDAKKKDTEILQEHDISVKNKLKEIQCPNLNEKLDDMNLKELFQLRLRLSKLVEKNPAVRMVNSDIKFDFKVEKETPLDECLDINNSEFHVVIQGCDLLLSAVDYSASVRVFWESDDPRTVFDVIFVTLNENPEYTLRYFNVHADRILCTELTPETDYAVTVRLHEERNTVSRPYFFTTLPSIECVDMLLSRKCHEDLYVGASGRKLFKRESHVPPFYSSFMRFEGTISNTDLTEPLMYWEVRLHSSYAKEIRPESYVSVAGICFVKDVDRVEDITDNYNSYLAGLGKNSRNRLDIFFSKEGSVIKSSELSWIQGRDVEVHLGFLLDLRRKTFYIIDVYENTLLCQIYVIKAPREGNPYVAVFGMGSDGDGCIEIISGNQIEELPSVLLDLLL